MVVVVPYRESVLFVAQSMDAQDELASLAVYNSSKMALVFACHQPALPGTPGPGQRSVVTFDWSDRWACAGTVAIARLAA
jgi:hypothetical protein